MSIPLSLAWKQRIFGVLDRFGLELERSDGAWPYSIRRKDRIGRNHQEDITTILAAPPACIFDVGAHIGQTAIAYRRAYPMASIYCFEPDPDNFAALVRNTRHDSRIVQINSAAGTARGTAELFRNVGSQTHSLLRVASGAERYVAAPAILQNVDSLTVPVTTLDDVATEVGRQPDLVKIDAQGYELQVLSGSSEVLRSTRPPLLYLEVSFVSQYADQPLFDDVYRWVYQRGYRLVGLYDTGFRTHYYVVGANALFVHETIGRRVATQ